MNKNELIVEEVVDENEIMQDIKIAKIHNL